MRVTVVGICSVSPPPCSSRSRRWTTASAEICPLSIDMNSASMSSRFMPLMTASSALDAVIKGMNLEDIDALFMSIDSGQISALAVVQRLDRELHGGGDTEQMPTTVTRMPRTSRTTRRTAGVYVEGLDDVMIHLARCCSPVPGDSIMG